MLLRSLYFCTLCFLISIPEMTIAERGRYSDGRAYRLDSEGNELVDYTAELEVQIDTLKQRIRSLQNENDSLRRNSAPFARDDSAVLERDLMPEARVVEQKIEAPDRTLQEIALLKREKEECMQARQAELQAGKECASNIVALRGELEKKQIRQEKAVSLSRIVPELEAEKIDLTKELQRLKILSVSQESEKDAALKLVESQRAELQSLRDKVSQLEQDVENQSARQAKLVREAAEEQRASLTDNSQLSTTSKGAVVLTGQAGVHGQSEDLMRDKLRTELTERLKSLESQVAKRDQLFQKFNASRSTLKVSPKAKRATFDLLRRQVPKSNFSQLRIYSKELQRFESDLREDLRTVQRMSTN